MMLPAATCGRLLLMNTSHRLIIRLRVGVTPGRREIADVQARQSADAISAAFRAAHAARAQAQQVDKQQKAASKRQAADHAAQSAAEAVCALSHTLRPYLQEGNSPSCMQSVSVLLVLGELRCTSMRDPGIVKVYFP